MEEITPEKILAALEGRSVSAPTIKLEIPHSGIDRKKRSPRSEAALRDAIRKAIVLAKHQSDWPHRYSEADGGQRVTEAEIHITALGVRSWGTESESILRYELSGRFGLYEDKSSGSIVATDKRKGDGDAKVVITIKAILVERVRSWAERLEAGEIGIEPDRKPYGVCICSHAGDRHAFVHGSGCDVVECACEEFVRDPSVPSPFVQGGWNDPAAQMRAEPEERVRVQAPRDEDPSPEEVEDEDVRMAILARMMRGEHALGGHSNDHGALKRVPPLTPIELAERFDAKSRRLDGITANAPSDIARAERIHAAHLRRVEESADRSKPGRPLKGQEPRMKLNERVEPADVLALARAGLSPGQVIAVVAAAARSHRDAKISAALAMDAIESALKNTQLDGEGHTPVTPAA